MQSFADIIDAWSKPDELAAALDVKRAMIACWKHRDSIPRAYWAGLIRAAQNRGLSEVTLDLLSSLAARTSEPQGKREGKAA